MMHILEKYVAGLNHGDAEEISALFAQECDFNDGGARPFGFPDVVASGKEGVKQTFEGVFAAYKVKAEIVKLNPASMEYDVTLGDLFIPCVGTVTCNEQGEITEYLVRPR